MMYPTTVVGFVARDGASPMIDGVDGRQIHHGSRVCSPTGQAGAVRPKLQPIANPASRPPVLSRAYVRTWVAFDPNVWRSKFSALPYASYWITSSAVANTFPDGNAERLVLRSNERAEIRAAHTDRKETLGAAQEISTSVILTLA
jgi:hypothetical protein